MKRLTLVAALLAMTLFATSAHAAFITSLTGNSRLSGGSLGSLVNFAVYENTGGDWRSTLGLAGVTTTLAGTIDGDATHIFMYQITRDTAALDANALLGTYTLPTALKDTTTWRGGGTLTGTVFSSGGAVVGASPGALNTLGVAAAVGAPTTGVAAPTFVANGTAVTPTFAGSLGANPTFVFPGNLATGAHSSVFFMTANLKPFAPSKAFLMAADADATGTASGLVPAGSGTSGIPVANPEPGSLALLSIGMFGGVLWRRRKKKQTDTAETPAV